MRVVEVNSLEGLPGLRLVWKSLLGETTGAGFHRSSQWFEAVYRDQPLGARLRILLVTGGGETIGIVPLVQVERRSPFGPARVLGYLADPWSPFHGPVGPQPMATLMASLRYLAGRPDWDILELRNLNCGAADYHRARTALQVAELRFHEVDETPFPVVHLPGKSQLLARLAAGGDASFQRHQPQGARFGDEEACCELFEECLRMAWPTPRSYSERDRQLLRNIHAAACRCGAADLNVLRRRGRIAACCYNVYHGGTLLSLFGGVAAASSASTAREDDPDWQLLVSRMLQPRDAQQRDGQQGGCQQGRDQHGCDQPPVHCWLPGRASRAPGGSEPDECGPVFPGTSLQRRASIIHWRRSGSRHWLRRVSRWLPRRAAATPSGDALPTV